MTKIPLKPKNYQNTHKIRPKPKNYQNTPRNIENDQNTP